MKKIIYGAGLVLAGGLGWLIGQHNPEPTVESTEPLVATVNGHGLELAWFKEQMQLRGGNRAGQYRTEEHIRALLDFLVNQEVIYQQALAEGYGDDPTIQMVHKKAVVDRYLQQTLNAELDQLTVKDSEVKAHFEANQTVYNKPARKRAAIIHVEINDRDNADTISQKRQKIQDALTAVESLDPALKHFGPLAREYSDDRASMYQGGVIGWLINHPGRQYKWDQQVLDSLFSMETVGEISPILETEQGFFIVRLVDHEKPQEKQLSQVNQGIKNRLLQEKQKQVKSQFMEQIMGQATVKIHEDQLASVQPLPGEPPSNEKKPPALPSMGGAQ